VSSRPTRVFESRLSRLDAAYAELLKLRDEITRYIESDAFVGPTVKEFRDFAALVTRFESKLLTAPGLTPTHGTPEATTPVGAVPPQGKESDQRNVTIAGIVVLVVLALIVLLSSGVFPGGTEVVASPVVVNATTTTTTTTIRSTSSGSSMLLTVFGIAVVGMFLIPNALREFGKQKMERMQMEHTKEPFESWVPKKLRYLTGRCGAALIITQYKRVPAEIAVEMKRRGYNVSADGFRSFARLELTDEALGIIAEIMFCAETAVATREDRLIGAITQVGSPTPPRVMPSGATQ